jgi:hypothetical protein
MPLDPSVIGRTYPPAAPFDVTVDRIRAFAESTGAAYTGGPAPASARSCPVTSSRWR